MVCVGWDCCCVTHGSVLQVAIRKVLCDKGEVLLGTIRVYDRCWTMGQRCVHQWEK